MATIAMMGTWIGEYELPKEHGLDRRSVSFTLRLTNGWFGRFSGTVQDDPQTGMPEPGTIKGKTMGLRVEFTKQMPLGYCRTAAGLVTIAQYYRGYGISSDDSDWPHQPIQYSGVYHPDQDAIAGEWRIAPFEIRLPDGRCLPSTGGTGTFWMKREH